MNELLNRLSVTSENNGATTGGSKGWIQTTGAILDSFSPIDGKRIASVKQATPDEYDGVVRIAEKAFQKWKMVPAPARGEIVREIGDKLREFKEDLGALVTLEAGKIVAEGEGEVQEMIDIADFSVGLSRQLYGLTMQSERPYHRMYEQWHPYGITGIVTAFNFPVAVWAWNALIAAVCGNTVIWKPSSKTPLTAIAVQNIIESVLDRHDLTGVFNLVIGKGSDVGETLINDKRIPLVSATGSTRMGQHVGEKVARRFGRSILELGGNNAIIVSEDADMDLALRATLFGAVGTAGQRCTTTRRIIIHNSIKETFITSLTKAYGQIPIGNPKETQTLMGPLIDGSAVKEMMETIEAAKTQEGKVLYGGKRYEGVDGGFYVTPCIIEAKNHFDVVQKETFAPILYIIGFDTVEEAIEINNNVPQGLSSAIFTNSMKNAEKFLSARGSDCGIANVNIGTSGAEIGGAFGGEKETGGGREAGSDSWKAYMRRQTCTLNWGEDLPLSQGISFDL